uniref:Myb/SANT-like DNA-binding domain-containing protein n=1 Tax=Knipowitschia caucasica TaxID=637954 RepID=A0AAV2JZY1_KNICA
MPKAKSMSVGAQPVKRKKNFSSSELEVLLLEVTRRKKTLFSSLSAGCTNTNKKEAWEAVWRAVDAVSGEGRSIEEVRKKWFDLKSETKRHIAKHRRETQRTGGGAANTMPMSDLDQRIGAIIGETALSGVPSTESLDTDGPDATRSSPPCAAAIPVEPEDEVPQRDPDPEPTEPSCSRSTRTRASPRPRLLSDAVLQNQEKIAESLEKIASTLGTISQTLKDLHEQLKNK